MPGKVNPYSGLPTNPNFWKEDGLDERLASYETETGFAVGLEALNGYQVVEQDTPLDTDLQRTTAEERAIEVGAITVNEDYYNEFDQMTGRGNE